MAYDAESKRIVLFGGYHLGFNAETWAYDVRSNTWQNMSPPTAPSGRAAFGMAYDEESDRVILFGGITTWYDFSKETWAYDLNNDTWTNMQPATSPPKTVGVPLAYDVRRDRVVLFGGHDPSGVSYNDTWTYDFNSNTWTRTTPTTSPPPHMAHVMAYDTDSDRVVLFGGAVGQSGSVGSDTWAYDAANETWVEMKPATSPTPRAFGAAIYDAKADRILMFGGDDEGENETWTYDLDANAWSRIDTASKPSDRGMHAMAYDAASDRTVLFGGVWPIGIITDPTTIKNRETWIFDRTSNTWTMVAGPLPPVAAFTYSPDSPAPGDALTFNASASSDPDGTIVRFEWDFGPGGTTSGVRANYTFVAAGTYTVKLTVTDDDGLTATVTQSVEVRAEAATTSGWLSSTALALITGAVVVVAVGVAVVLLLRRRRPRTGS